MTIALASDHGGYELKNIILEHLKEKNIETIDYGVYSCAPGDYPDSAVPVCEAVLSGKAGLGILACGTGIGISIAANKIPGVYCGLVSDCFSAKASRWHNNTNMIALGARVIGPGLALEIVDTWLETEFKGGRHQKRIDKIIEIEKRYLNL